jgi:hypothetical protein
MGVTYLPFTVSSDAGYADRVRRKIKRPGTNVNVGESKLSTRMR